MLNNVNIDNEKVQNGAWCFLHHSRFKVAHQSNKKMQTAISKIFEPLSEEDSLRLIAKYVLLDWKLVKTIDGDFIDYSEDVAFNALCSNEELRNFVLESSLSYFNFTAT